MKQPKRLGITIKLGAGINTVTVESSGEKTSAIDRNKMTLDRRKIFDGCLATSYCQLNDIKPKSRKACTIARKSK